MIFYIINASHENFRVTENFKIIELWRAYLGGLRSVEAINLLLWRRLRKFFLETVWSIFIWAIPRQGLKYNYSCITKDYIIIDNFNKIYQCEKRNRQFLSKSLLHTNLWISMWHVEQHVQSKNHILFATFLLLLQCLSQCTLNAKADKTDNGSVIDTMMYQLVFHVISIHTCHVFSPVIANVCEKVK